MNVITCANMPPNENVSGGSHNASTNVSLHALRLRTSVRMRVKSASAFASRASSASGVGGQPSSSSGARGRLRLEIRQRTAGQRRRPHFLRLDDAAQQLAQALGGRVPGEHACRVRELAIELIVAQPARVLQELARVKGVGTGKDLEQVHRIFS